VIDGNNNVYVAGRTEPRDFPIPGTFDSLVGSSRDGFVSKFDDTLPAAASAPPRGESHSEWHCVHSKQDEVIGPLDCSGHGDPFEYWDLCFWKVRREVQELI